MASPIIPWVGGKRRLADTLIARFPPHTCYVEVFAGGAALYFVKAPSPVEVINDINSELVNLYRVVQRHFEEFTRQFEWALSSREVFDWMKRTPPETLTDIERAARFFYLLHHTFGAKANDPHWGVDTSHPAVDLPQTRKTLSAAHARLAATSIEHLDWRACIDRYDRPHTLFYLDPPYWQVEGYGVPFPWPEYQALAERMHTLQGKAILSINDHPDIRRCFAGLQCEQTPITYIIRGADQRVERTELIIYSWDKQADPAGLF